MYKKYGLLFFAFALLFLFYPGDSFYLHLFAFSPPNQNALPPKKVLEPTPLPPIPYLQNVSPPFLTAEGVYVLDFPSYTPLYERNVKEKLFPASTTKIITALVTMDVFDPEDVVTVKRNGIVGQVMDLVPGEKITVENLLYGLLVHSANDAAYALADAYGYDSFVKKMNAKAHSLGMDNSSFANPAGLDNMEQLTTPRDLALASRSLLTNKLLKKIVSTKEITVSDVDFVYFHQLVNVNKLLGEIQGIGGLKTGYTEAAGENLISYYRKNGHEFIIVILKSADRFQDTRNLVRWLDENVKYYSLK